MTKCNDESVKTHDIEWQPQQCVDGGIFRAKKNYTNILTSGFNTDIGYSGHYYGIRKYTGLIPETAYYVTIRGKTGEDIKLAVPREIRELEYGSNNNVNYSGIKLVNDNFRTENALFGKSVAATEDYLAVGVPKYGFQDTEGHFLENAGTVLLYKRNPAPSGFDWSNQYDKANFVLEQQINLPSGFLRDYIKDRVVTQFLPNIGQLSNTVKKNVWKVGQNGRQFGHSVDLCVTDNLEHSLGEDKKNILIVGGPSCRWDRSFDLIPSGVGVCVFVFTDNFLQAGTNLTQGNAFVQPDKIDYDTILQNISNIDLIYRYFCDPPTKFDIKINILECLVPNDEKVIYELTLPKPENISKYVGKRHFGFDPNYKNTETFQVVDSGLFSLLQESFFKSFPYDTSKLNNNIPPIIGFFIDDSLSFGGIDSLNPALDRFISFYQEYSFASGLTDFFGVRSSGFPFKFSAIGDNWTSNTNSILINTLAIENLKGNNAERFFANSIGEFNPNAPELNNPPDSGGRVYIFEKESGSWNLIQSIESPTKLNDVYPDRFGHDVKISDNGEIIVIGSPYTYTSFFAYEYDPNEKKRFYNNIESWLTFRKNEETIGNEYSTLYNKLEQYKSQMSDKNAIEKFYLELSSTNKYKARTDYDYWKDNYIQEYKETFTYTNQAQGVWPWFADIVIPNPRLGYSVAVNDDGSIIAAGSPTDSLNEYDSISYYYSPERPNFSTWSSYVNAGCVRVFESRKYFPHNTVAEYGIFGNLEYNTAPANEKQFFNHMSGIYSPYGLKFVRTEFADVDIPENAGLLFITTPQIDAASDEILTNIKNWLALGDRNLVLVGNDPIWEKDGLYFNSNEIINKLLRKLKSRVKIIPARNISEALSDGIDTGKSNLISSTKPEFSFQTYINQNPLIGSGVGDIKPYLDEDIFSQRMLDGRNIPCIDFVDTLIPIDTFKNIYTREIPIPIKNLGDLRSLWYDNNKRCGKNPLCHFDRKIEGYINSWFVFLSTNNYAPYVNLGEFYDEKDLLPSYDEDGNLIPSSYVNNFPLPQENDKRLDALPILTVSQYPEPYEVIYPGRDAYTYLERGEEIRTYVEGPSTIAKAFDARNVFPSANFIWSADQSNYTSLNFNIRNISSTSLFFKPEPYNGKKPILQAQESSNINSYLDTIDYSDIYLAARCNYKDTNSLIYLLSSCSTIESEEYITKNNKQIAFFFNIVAKNINGGSFVAQLGDFTGRKSFKDLYQYSSLERSLIQTRNSIDLNVSLDNLLKGKQTSVGIVEYDVCFILQPLSLPNEEQLYKLKSWIERGNKKVIIMYDTNDLIVIDRMKTLCDQLSSIMKPMYLPVKGKYATVGDSKYSLIAEYAPINQNLDIYNRFEKSKLNSVALQEFNLLQPIELNGAELVLSLSGKVKDNVLISKGIYELDTGTVEVKFPCLPGSGYTLFITQTADFENETRGLVFYGDAIWLNWDFIYDKPIVKNLPPSFLLSDKPYEYYIQEYEPREYFLFPDTNQYRYNFDINQANNDPIPPNTIKHTTIYLQAKDNQNIITLYINAPFFRRISGNQYIEKTPKLLGISGCLTPYKNVEIKTGRIDISYGPDIVKTSPPVPETKVTVFPPPEPLRTDVKKYLTDSCPTAYDTYGDTIEDGPIVVAQEFEILSNFEFGVNRSRITIISDSSLIQGKGILDSGNRIKQENVDFLLSLYPFTNFPSSSRGRSFTDHITKIQSPEVLTPQILFNCTGNNGHNLRFQTSGVESSGKNLINFPHNFDERFYEPLFRVEDGEASAYITPWKVPPPKDEEKIKAEKIAIINNFINDAKNFGAYSKFAGTIEGKYYEDASVFGGIPKIMEDTGYDYLDFDRFPSGYPGNLFGYSIDIYKNKILIGSPFSAYNSESLISWSGVVANTPRYNLPSGSIVGYNGGAGSVYLYERSSTAKTPFGRDSRWGCSKKFRPDSINIGQDTDNLDIFNSGIIFGNHNYKAEDLTLSIINDRFGSSVKIYSDILVIGAPGHDFENYTQTIFNSGQFMKKSFDVSFDLPQRTIYDLGTSGIRSTLDNSGVAVLNNGAIFVYENRLSNWVERKQNWQFIQKVVPQGYNSRKQKTYVGSSEIPVSGSENDYFGSVLALNKKRRTDSDYCIIVGTPMHKFGIDSSGAMISNGGAAYIYDGILRYEQDITLDSNNFIQARVFGAVDSSGNPSLNLNFANDEANKVYETSGIIYSNSNGDIFLEASGQDLTNRIYIRHRPYITDIFGEYLFGTELPRIMPLFVNGEPNLNSGIFNLFSSVPNSAIVYNELGLYQSAILDFASGVPSGLSLYTDCPSGIEISESGFALYASGTGFYPETLDLRVRGK